jgi:hypothetical protein
MNLSTSIIFQLFRNVVKKSIFTFGLLASSLVMLSAIPLLNNNAAMAQEYYDDSSYYSQYPTDDKKYECRTGPFEGFFVGSVEFCKFNKFDKDDRKDARDNRTGTQGPPGPASTIPGPQGPAGPSEINSTRVYQNTSAPTTMTAGADGPSSAGVSCNTGDTALNGGFAVLEYDEDSNNFDLLSITISSTDVIVFGDYSGATNTALLFARISCFDNTP